MLQSRSIKKLAYVLLALAILLFASSVVTSIIRSNGSSPHKTLGANISGLRPFVDTWNNIHLFLTFDYRITSPSLSVVANRYDFIWGSQLHNASLERVGNPNIFRTSYMPFHRDYGTFAAPAALQSLAYWQANHPDWVLYKCDRKTPAYEYSNPNIPFDFSNPNVIAWQIQTYAQPASENQYDGIAADNVNLSNYFGACGTYQNGQWVQRYTGLRDDPKWRADVITWLAQMQQGLHNLPHPLALIINFDSSPLAITDPQVQQAVSFSDGILDEGGFTHNANGYLTGNDWQQRIQFMEYVQSQNKPYFTVNLFHTNVLSRDKIQWALSSYLIAKEHWAYVYISSDLIYGADAWLGEYNAQIGSPNTAIYQAQNVYWRGYTNGLSIVNPSATTTYIVNISNNTAYRTLYGDTIGKQITLVPHSGIVLLGHP